GGRGGGEGGDRAGARRGRGRDLRRARDEPVHRRTLLKPDPALKLTLDDVRSRCDVEARRASDPVGLVHDYAHPLDQELVGLMASSIAFGNVKTIRAKLSDALARLGPRPSVTADDPLLVFARMHG